MLFIIMSGAIREWLGYNLGMGVFFDVLVVCVAYFCIFYILT